MVTHWESSQRPLFVKTVWKDGYHHVVLNVNEKPETSVIYSKSRTPTYNPVENNKTTKRLPSSHSLEISSARVLPASAENIKKTVKTHRIKSSYVRRDFSKPWQIDVAPNSSLKYKNINDEVVLTNEDLIISVSKPKALKLSGKSNSFDVNKERSSEDDFRNENCDTIASSFNSDKISSNTLSERVLLWLDLVLQNGSYQNDLTLSGEKTDIRKRIETANETQRKILLSNKYKKYSSFDTDDISDLSQKYQQEVNNNQEFIDDSILKSSALVEQKSAENKPNVTIVSRLEESQIPEVLQESPVKSRNRCNTAKRQLHVFIPRLQKKCSESNSSLLSSKSSSLYQKYY